MTGLRRTAAGWGIVIPPDAVLVIAGIALATSVAACLVAFLVGRSLGPRLARAWERHAGSQSEGMAARMCSLVRNLVACVLLTIVLQVYSWPPLASLIIGFVLAAAAALAVAEIIRGIHLPRWNAATLGIVVFILVFTQAAGGLPPVTDLLDRIGFSAGTHRFSLLTALQVVVTILALFAIVRLLNRIVAHWARSASTLDSAQQLLAQKLGSVALLVAAFFIGIDLLGIDLTALTVFSGAFGLAVGFGLQKTFGNLIAGIILLMDRSIKPGDVIVVGDSVGSVNKIGVRAVSVITRDGKEHLIPNENLMTQEVENWSYSSPNVRIRIPVGVAYGTDLPLAQRLMVDAAMTPQRVLKTPKPVVWLRAFGANALEHEIRVWISDPEAGLGNIQSEILNRLWLLFQENGIELPFPQRDIRVKEWPAAAPSV